MEGRELSFFHRGFGEREEERWEMRDLKRGGR